MKIITRRILLFVMLLVAGNVFAQVTLQGIVADSLTQEPLIGASLYLVGTSLGNATNVEGEYKINNIPEGEYQIRISYVGYKTKFIKLSLKGRRAIDLFVQMATEQIEGKTIVVTAQAEGQLSAINQQLSSNTISNVVSKARIKELPDVNAAESIGRLPGISIQRSGGEANKIEIRGLSPKYNAITVNGVNIPATGGDDRSVDLALISSNMLDGIEVKKANTPDMDADALGGSVDLRLREAPDKMEVSVNGQWGANAMKKYYGNYNFAGTISNRFLDGDLGAVVTFNFDSYDRSADRFSGNYIQSQNSVTKETEIIASSLSLSENTMKRGRVGASFLFDYKIPAGKITANGFYNSLNAEGFTRQNQLNKSENRHYYNITDANGKTGIYTVSLGIKQDFDWIKYDLSLSKNESHYSDPTNYAFQFVQENSSFTGTVTADTDPRDIPKMATIDSVKTGFANINVRDYTRDEQQSSLQFNVTLPFNLYDITTGYVKVGGKWKGLTRWNDENDHGVNGLQYGNGSGPNPTLADLDLAYPDWGIKNLVRQNGVLPITAFLTDYTRDNFLNGEYPLGFVANRDMLKQAADYLSTTSRWLTYAVNSRGRDYDGHEEYQALYAMAEFNFMDNLISFTPGVRWEKDYSKYHGQRYREVTINNTAAAPADLGLVESVRQNEFLLPMIHLKVQPTDWLKIRLARTETLTRPDYMQYTPISSINSYASYVRAANTSLKPAHSTNWDASLSIFENNIGLLTVAGFYKTIKDLIFQVTINYRSGITLPDGLLLPDGTDKYLNDDGTYASNWLKNASPQIDTYINNEEPAIYKGVEIDWQTHFWYLPSVFSGLILNVNYTYITSDIGKKIYYVINGPIIPGSRPPRYSQILTDSLRHSRMPDQPTHIANVTIGYDLGGFSARLSYLYQTDKTAFISTQPILDQYTGPYSRLDLTLQQKINDNFQVFANFNNLNNTRDISYRGNTLINPTYMEYYGFTTDVGIRYKL